MNVVGLSLKRMSEGVLPPGRALDLQGRGTGYVYAAPAPPGAPTLVLVHGLWATGSLNWFPAFEALSSRFGVVATDLRGHGRGIPVSGHFRVADCADDIAALVDELGTGPVILVGYSLGGVVAQMAWRRHPRCVAGLVLCATSRNFGGSRPERIFYRSLSGALFGASMLQRARQRGVALPPAVEAAAVAAVDEVATVAAEVGAVGAVGATGRRMPAWAWDEMKRTDVLASLGAVAAIGRFSSREWVHEIDVPTAVVVTARDHFISPVRQRKLAAAIPGATVYEVPSDHAACVLGAEHFVPALVDACTSVATRVAARAA